MRAEGGGMRDEGQKFAVCSGQFAVTAKGWLPTANSDTVTTDGFQFDLENSVNFLI